MQFDRQGSVAPSTLNRGRPGQVVRIGEVHPETRVVPRHVYEMNKVSHVTMTVPEGYRRAFDDGRLNTKRAEMTFAGVSRTNQIWTEKTPRRLIIPRVGE
ncbi:hypothetical protein CLV88_101550 [Shimia abyssi]|uniref:Uncharacterized protein n=2 Tax=Shimia abyssi TaxID=1662395 RepID=A0A2P8FKA8_9RHOB|nr:hypothetical protein CLV88_101550 [Shimia abyssi]